MLVLDTSMSLSNKLNMHETQQNNTPTARKVFVTVNMIKLGDIDIMNERYQAVFNIELKWFEKSNELTQDKYDPKKNFNPQIHVENIFQDIMEDVSFEVTKLPSSEYSIVTEKRRIKGYFWERLEIENFPIDIQELSLVLASRLTIDKVVLIENPDQPCEMDPELASKFVDQQKWTLYNLVKTSDTPSYELNQVDSVLNLVSKNLTDHAKPPNPMKKVSKFVTTGFCSRKPGYFVWNAYFLSFLITLSSLAIFAMDCRQPQARLNTTFTLLLTSVTFKWVVNRSLPTVSYLTSLDKYGIVCIFYICLICVWHSVIGSMSWGDDRSCGQNDYIGLISFACLQFIIHTSFVVWFFVAYSNIKKLKKKEFDYVRSTIERCSSSKSDQSALILKMNE